MVSHKAWCLLDSWAVFSCKPAFCSNSQPGLQRACRVGMVSMANVLTPIRSSTQFFWTMFVDGVVRLEPCHSGRLDLREV